MVRTMTNITGDCACSIVIARSEKKMVDGEAMDGDMIEEEAKEETKAEA